MPLNSRFPQPPELPPGCERFLGSVDFMNDHEARDARLLSGLRVIDGQVTFFRNYSLESLDGLDRLEEVGQLTIRDTALPSLAALGQLRRVDGVFGIASNRNLQGFRGLERLESVGSLSILGNPEATSLDGLSGLQEVRGNARLWDLPRAEIDAFVARVRIDGEVDVIYSDE
ncbi:MAG: hypothetical protein AAGF12_29700 [Myxococcota bacterium]